MRSLNLEGELILSVSMTEVGKLLEFLESLDLRHEFVETRDVVKLLKSEESKDLEGVWNVESEEGEALILVIGARQFHLFLKKNEHFEQLKEKALQHFHF